MPRRNTPEDAADTVRVSKPKRKIPSSPEGFDGSQTMVLSDAQREAYTTVLALRSAIYNQLTTGGQRFFDNWVESQGLSPDLNLTALKHSLFIHVRDKTHKGFRTFGEAFDTESTKHAQIMNSSQSGTRPKTETPDTNEEKMRASSKK